jgi:hypothetical protein
MSMGTRMAMTFAVIGVVAGTANADRTAIGFGAGGGTAPFPEDVHATVITNHLYATHWIGRFGLSAEGSLAALTRSFRGGGWALGGRAHVLVGDGAMSINDRSVAYALELAAIVQREWWDFPDELDDKPTTPEAERTSYGVGAGILLGGMNPGGRVRFDMHLDVRLMFARRAIATDSTVSARAAVADEPARSVRDTGVLVALRVDWGSAD